MFHFQIFFHNLLVNQIKNYVKFIELNDELKCLNVIILAFLLTLFSWHMANIQMKTKMRK